MQLDTVIGSASSFLDLMDRISRAAPLNKPILVIGERGSGKELVAARLHFLSERWNQPYQKLNCAALPENLLESELFGHEAGAFTGASKRRHGRFELADQGSLFLDEIALMSLSTQEKLLRVIEYGEFERLGSSETKKINVRLIGATNIDLPQAADQGLFRHDLLDRLAFDVLTVPPLRARREDILPLANYFGQKMASELGWPHFPSFTKNAQKALEDYDWPGNIRELKNLVERAVYRQENPALPLGELVFDPFDSPWRPQKTKDTQKHANDDRPIDNRSMAFAESEQSPQDFKGLTMAFEKKLLLDSLAAHQHHQKNSAKACGLSYDQFRHLLRKHQISA